MPNMCHSRIAVTGPADDLQKFRNRCFVTDDAGDLEFSFDAIIPMPAIFVEDCMISQDDLCLVALGADPGQIGSLLTIDKILAFDWVVAAGIRSREELLVHLETTADDRLVSARLSLAALIQTGYASGYMWRIEHWGTKWPASFTEILADHDDHVEFRFANPWAFPEPVLFELGVLFPTLRFDFTALDPDTGEGARGYVMGREDVQEPIAETEVDVIAEWIFRPQAGESTSAANGSPSYYSLLAARCFFAIAETGKDSRNGTDSLPPAGNVGIIYDDLVTGRISACTSRREILERYGSAASCGDPWHDYRQALHIYAEDRGCLVLIDNAASDEEVCHVASFDAHDRNIDEAELIARSRTEMNAYLERATGREAAKPAEPRFFPVYRVPPGDYSDATRAFFEERGDHLLTVGIF